MKETSAHRDLRDALKARHDPVWSRHARHCARVLIQMLRAHKESPVD